jgi:hypothetical protein
MSKSNRKPYLDRMREARAVQPCVCGHAKREHEGQTGACMVCDCMEYVLPDDAPAEQDD